MIRLVVRTVRTIDAPCGDGARGARGAQRSRAGLWCCAPVTPHVPTPATAAPPALEDVLDDAAPITTSGDCAWRGWSVPTSVDGGLEAALSCAASESSRQRSRALQPRSQEEGRQP